MVILRHSVQPKGGEQLKSSVLHMSWVLFVVAPFLLGIGIVAFPSVRRQGWLFFVGMIACIEVVLIGFPSPTWNVKQVVIIWFFGVILPWGIIISLVPFFLRGKNLLLTLVGLPTLYFLLLMFGLVLGDVFGLISQ